MDREMMLANDASIKEMEGAALAWVTELLDVPFFAIKVVTDIVDGDKPTQDEFLENLSTAAKALEEAVPRVVEFISKAGGINDL
jgi:5'-methylthioadenosine nucleosidase